jgi:hypothetical protein
MILWFAGRNLGSTLSLNPPIGFDVSG